MWSSWERQTNGKEWILTGKWRFFASTGGKSYSFDWQLYGVFRQFLGNFHGRWMDIQEWFSFSYRLNETFFICFVCGPWTSAKKRTKWRTKGTKGSLNEQRHRLSTSNERNFLKILRYAFDNNNKWKRTLRPFVLAESWSASCLLRVVRVSLNKNHK